MDRHSLIRAALHGLAAARIGDWLPHGSDSARLIVTLHHVRPHAPSAFDPNALLAVTPDFLDRFLSHFIASGWRFVAVDELICRSGPADARRIAVTLDDGYRNNAEFALPLFRRHAVPFSIYVCPGFCDRTAELWWEALERIIAATNSL
jgi:peptidoglycan/xylan/chitin deacetylase (PgdA/CDA1 family)